MSTKTVTVTTRSRNLAYGCTNTPTGNGTEISTPTCPTKQGGRATLQAQRAQCQKINSGGVSFKGAFFVGRKRVIVGHDAMVEFCTGQNWAPSEVQVELEG
jgi:hypothetical protein